VNVPTVRTRRVTFVDGVPEAPAELPRTG
jgi:hypothetical protein